MSGNAKPAHYRKKLFFNYGATKDQTRDSSAVCNGAINGEKRAREMYVVKHTYKSQGYTNSQKSRERTKA